MQKYPKGTLVEITKHEWRPDLVGKRFVVDVAHRGKLRMGRGADEVVLDNVLIYMTPFPSTRPGYKGRNVGIPEEHLRPVYDSFPEDKGFEFDESKSVWLPTVVIEDGEVLVV